MKEHFCSLCFECLSISTDRNYIILKAVKYKKGKNLWHSIKHPAQLFIKWNRARERERGRMACAQKGIHNNINIVIIIKPKIKHLSGHDFQINSTFAWKWILLCVRAYTVYLLLFIQVTEKSMAKSFRIYVFYCAFLLFLCMKVLKF